MRSSFLRKNCYKCSPPLTQAGAVERGTQPEGLAKELDKGPLWLEGPRGLVFSSCQDIKEQESQAHELL